MSYVFNPFTGNFDDIGNGGSGITFPDLASPPNGTTLGSEALPFDETHIDAGVKLTGVGSFDVDGFGSTANLWIRAPNGPYNIALTNTDAGANHLTGIFIDDVGNFKIWPDINGAGIASLNWYVLDAQWKFIGGQVVIASSPTPASLVVEGPVTATDFIVSGSAFKTDTTNGHQAFFQAYDVDGAAYKTFATLTNGNTPNFALSAPSGGTLSGDFTTLKIGGVNVGTGSGTVTSVAASVPAFLSITGSPVTSSGTLAITYSGTALPVANGGTAATSASITAFNNITGYSAAGATGTTSTNLVFSTSPTLVTPTLGAATATTINGNAFTAGSYTLTGAASKTLTFSNSLTLAGTDATTMTFPTTSATIARTDAANTFTGTQTFSGTVAIPNGALATPSLNFSALGTNYGLYAVSSSRYDFVFNGATTFNFSSDATLALRATTGNISFNNDTTLSRPSAAVLQMGIDVNGAAVNQTFQAANGITGTDKTGGNLTNRPGAGTGAATVSSYIVQTPTAGVSGTTAQTQTTRLTISEAGAVFTGKITTIGGATFHTTSSALTDGAGASAGTITNAPSIGNPTKWIGINDNGTTRYIPAW